MARWYVISLRSGHPSTQHLCCELPWEVEGTFCYRLGDHLTLCALSGAGRNDDDDDDDEMMKETYGDCWIPSLQCQNINSKMVTRVLLVCSSASATRTSASRMPSMTTDTSASLRGLSAVACWISCSRIGSATSWIITVDTDRSACWHTDTSDWMHFSRTWQHQCNNNDNDAND